MKQEFQSEKRKRGPMYVSAKVKVTEIIFRQVICISTLDANQNESYQNGDTSEWFNN
ncbi:MAG: hypothetical protein KBS95_00990 [Alistipes sp.]|nr:hypothetical protein [Candidatus Alistipes equi]